MCNNILKTNVLVMMASFCSSKAESQPVMVVHYPRHMLFQVHPALFVVAQNMISEAARNIM